MTIRLLRRTIVETVVLLAGKSEQSDDHANLEYKPSADIDVGSKSATYAEIKQRGDME